MNWKLIGALILGAGLVTACGAGQQEPASPAPGREPAPEEAKPGSEAKPGMMRSAEPEAPSPEGASPADGAAGGAPPPGASPNLQPQGIMVPERKDK